MYGIPPDGASVFSQILKPLERTIVQALDDEARRTLAKEDALRLACPACRCDRLTLIASGTQVADKLAVYSGAGHHVINDLPTHPLGPAAITVFLCSTGHIAVEWTRATDHGVYRGAEWYDIKTDDAAMLVAMLEAK